MLVIVFRYVFCTTCFIFGVLGNPPPWALRGSRSFQEENYICSADPSFVEKCLPNWQDECRRVYSHNEELRTRLCETELNRNYVRIRTLIPPDDILDQWKWDKQRRDYDEGFFRTQLPQFTTTGFKLVPLPVELHSAMADWYGRNKHRSHPERSQPAFGMHCNTGHDNDDWQVPYHAANREDRQTFAAVQEFIRKQLEEWTGQDVNENTAIYGVRQYHRGSICGMHTDAHETHAFSAIYQLDQRGMDEPWGLDYVTHEGKEGRSFLKAGDVMMYESASGLHGRKDPLKGDEFSNIFFHFRSPNWMPAVEKVMGNYWPRRHQFEQSRGVKLTSLADAPQRTRRWAKQDTCIPLRNRTNPLMVEGHFMDTPPLKQLPAASSSESSASNQAVPAALQHEVNPPHPASLAEGYSTVPPASDGPFTVSVMRCLGVACAAAAVLTLFVRGRRTILKKMLAARAND